MYSRIQLYVYIYNYMRKHCQHNIRTSMNERTNFFTKIYLSHFIRKGWCRLCVRGELETGTDCHILTQSSSHDHSSTSSISWLGCSTVGHWEPKPSVWSWFSLHGHPISNCDSNWLTQTDWPKPSVAPGYIIVWCPPASYGRTHLHRIQPHPQVKVIFRYLWTDAPVLSLDWWLGRGSICNYFPQLEQLLWLRQLFDLTG